VLTSSRPPDDDPSLIEIDAKVATPNEVSAATVALGQELGQFGSG
jgi:hypothetical protein